MLNIQELERAAYERTGQPEPFEDTAALIDTIDRSILPESLHLNPYVLHTARETLWVMGDDAVRRVMAVGSIAVRCWPGTWPGQARNRLYFQAPWEIRNYAQMTDSGELAVTSLLAVGEQYKSDMGNVSGKFVPWAASVSTLATEPQLEQINQVLGAVKFSDHHTDSEDMGSPHDVGEFLKNTALPISFRRRLMEVALNDAKSTSYKPHVWQAQMGVTLRAVAKDPDNLLRFAAREELELPVSDNDYQLYLNELAAQRAREHDERSRQHEKDESWLEVQRDIVRATIARILRERKSATDVYDKT